MKNIFFFYKISTQFVTVKISAVNITLLRHSPLIGSHSFLRLKLGMEVKCVCNFCN